MPSLTNWDMNYIYSEQLNLNIHLYIHVYVHAYMTYSHSQVSRLGTAIHTYMYLRSDEGGPDVERRLRYVGSGGGHPISVHSHEVFDALQ